MSFIQVTAQELRNRASELQGLNSRLKVEIENLVNCQNNLNTMWEGEAKDAFNQTFIRNRGTMDNFKNAIDQYIEALIVVSQRYEEAENRNVSIASCGIR